MERLRLIEHQCDSLMQFTLSPSALHVNFNRPRSLNSLTIPMASSFLEAALNCPAAEIILTSSGDKAFCAGGSVIGFQVDSSHTPVISSKLLYHLMHRGTPRMAVMKGIVFGAGAAVSFVCDVKVVTDSTLWAVPESAIGSFCDLGMTYHLSRLRPEGLGLYLALTGQSLNGAEAYALGIATHYVKNDDLPALMELARKASAKEAADALHREPARDACVILEHLPTIQECFGTANSLDEILNKLATDGSAWAESQLKLLLDLCPLSLVVTFKNLSLSKSRSFKEVLEGDFDLTMQMMGHRNINFQVGVTHKLVKKLKTVPAWQPPHIAQVDDSLVTAIFTNAEGPHLVLDSQ
jgi:enoyl-CoA hydratase/carnithine racemase